MKYHIENISCEGCARSIAKVVKATDPQALVTVDVATKMVDIRSAAPEDSLRRALTAAGYAPGS